MEILSSSHTGLWNEWCDADDWYEKNMVEEMVIPMEMDYIDFAMCETNVVHDENLTERLLLENFKGWDWNKKPFDLTLYKDKDALVRCIEEDVYFFTIKNKKAKELGIPILSEEDFMEKYL